MKNALLLMAVRLLQRCIRPSPIDGLKSILVVASTALGDTLWATPALESLRTSWPQANIVVLTSPIGEEVLRHNPWTNKIVILREPMLLSFLGLWRQLKQQHFQEIVIFHASQRLILPLCSLLGAPKIIGTAGINKGLDQLLTHPMPASKDHEIVRRLKLIEHMGAKRTTEKLSFFLQPEERIHSSKHQCKVALHPGSKDSFKRWPAEHFIELGQKLSQSGLQIHLTGTAQEEPLLQQIARGIPGAIINDPTKNLRQFAAQLETFDLLISNDTGPVHLACALGVPVIALYSPTNPQLCGPHVADNALAIAKPPSCDACLKRKCRRAFCLMQIGADEVFRQAANLLQI